MEVDLASSYIQYPKPKQAELRSNWEKKPAFP